MAAPQEIRKVLGIGLPLLAYYFSETAIGLTDLYIVGQLGSAELAAVGLGKTLVFGWLILGFCMLSMVSVLGAEALAQSNRKRLLTVLVQGFWLVLLLALLGKGFIFILLWALPLLGYEAELLVLLQTYLGWVAWMLLPGLLFALLRNLLTVLSRTRVFMMVSMIAVLANYGLNQVLVFGRLGFPALGISGAAIATVLVNLLSLGVLAYYVYRREPELMRAWGQQLGQFQRRAFTELSRLGLPAGGLQFLESGFFIAISMLIALYGTAWLAANNVLLAVLEVNYIIMLALGEALAVRIAYQRGLGQPLVVRTLVRFGLISTAVVTLALTAVLGWFPELFVRIFMNAEAPGYHETLEHAIVLAGIAVLFLCFDGLQVSTTWMLRGFRDTLVPMLIGVMGYWLVGIGLGAWLSFGLGWGAPGLWWGFAAGLSLAGCFLLLRLWQRVARIEA